MRRRRFRKAASPVNAHPGVLTKGTACRGCGQAIAAGETVMRVRLKKAYQVPCTTCGHLPPKLKVYHPHCVPPDLFKAMGVSPNAPRAAPGGAVAPPKVTTPEEAALAALSSLEQALAIKAARRGVTPEMEKSFKTFQGLKARVLRPGTPAEGEVATSLALKRIIDLVFA